MIHVTYNSNRNSYAFDFGGPNFATILEAVRDVDVLRFDEYTRMWKGGLRDARQMVDELQWIEPITYGPGVEERLLKLHPETERWRVGVDRSLISSDPLAEYQIKEVYKGVTANRHAYFLDMGLGKTWILVQVLNHLWDWGWVDRVLILAPSDAIYNWRDELIMFSGGRFNADSFYIASPENREPFQSDAPIILSTYTTFRALSDSAYKKKMGKRSTKYRIESLQIGDWVTNSARCLICDESHLVKNPQARQTKLVLRYAHHFHYRYLLSGTPDPNGIEGYWAQMDLLDPEIIGRHYYDWITKVANCGNRFGDYVVNYYYSDAVEAFTKRIKPWVSRRFVEEELDLPEKHVKTVKVPLSQKHRRLYQQLVVDTLHVVKEENGGELIPKKVEEKFPYISQALDNPCLLADKVDKNRSPALWNLVEKWKFSDHSKLEPLDELVARVIAAGKKLIIWDFHPLTIDQLCDHYGKYNPLAIHGQTPVPGGVGRDEYKSSIVEEFKRDGKRQLLIASSYVLSMSYTITECHHAVYFSRPWDWTAYEQSSRRIYRATQNQTTYIRNFVSLGTLEVYQNAQLERKGRMNRDLFNADSLTKDQWRSIFDGTAVDWQSGDGGGGGVDRGDLLAGL